ncbi:MAG: hypothetical protein ACPG7F_10980 [Aggregatilineales bacterium]
MSRFGQIGIALGTLGVVLALMGLFPELTGVRDTPGIGIVQVMMLLIGYALLTSGALIYIKFTFYAGVSQTLLQQIGIRLTMTGLLFAALSGLSDILGFGSHVRSDISDLFFGYLQAIGIIASFAISSIGALIYALAGYNVMVPGDTVPASRITSEMHRVVIPALDAEEDAPVEEDTLVAASVTESADAAPDEITAPTRPTPQ